MLASFHASSPTKNLLSIGWAAKCLKDCSLKTNPHHQLIISATLVVLTLHLLILISTTDNPRPYSLSLSLSMTVLVSTLDFKFKIKV
jgi:hypothetical protein